MPRKRAHPNRIFDKALQRPYPNLNAKQCTRLEKIAGLPRAALPAIQIVAELYVFISLYAPTAAEMRATLKILLKRVLALRDDFFEADFATRSRVLTHYYTALDVINEDAIKPVTAVLSFCGTFDLLKRVIETSIDLTHRPDDFPGSVTALARQLQDAFQKFDVPFSLRKNSPAVETVFVIANMARPTKRESARHAVWLARGTKERPR